MGQEDASRQFSFRLPDELVQRIERCMKELQSAGLEVTRADVVRMLIKHALDATQCKLNLLLGGRMTKKGNRRR